MCKTLQELPITESGTQRPYLGSQAPLDQVPAASPASAHHIFLSIHSLASLRFLIQAKRIPAQAWSFCNWTMIHLLAPAMDLRVILESFLFSHSSAPIHQQVLTGLHEKEIPNQITYYRLHQPS